MQACATIAAFVAVAAGYGAKRSRVQRSELALSRADVGSGQAEIAYRELKAALNKQKSKMHMMHAKLATKEVREA